MKNDKIRKLVLDIKNECSSFLDYVDSYNECAFSDRILENIINKSNQLSIVHNNRFSKLTENNKKVKGYER